MFEKIKYGWNVGLFLRYGSKLQEAIHAKDIDSMRAYSEKARYHGKRAIDISETLPEGPDEDISIALEGIEKFYNLLQKQAEIKEENTVRKAVKRQYVKMGTQMGVLGEGRAEDFIADRMVDMYRIAADRLDAGEQLLRMLYVDNEAVPEPLREVMSQYVDGKITKDETENKLNELKERTESYVRDLGAEPGAAKTPSAVFHNTPSPEDRLKAELYADSLDDNGQVNQRELFEKTAEIAILDEWAGVAKSIGDRNPNAEELIAGQMNAYRRTFENNPIGFENEEEFEAWLHDLESGLMEKKDDYLKAAIPLYKSITERLVAKDGSEDK